MPLNSWAWGVQIGKRWGQPGPEEGPAAFSEESVCLGFYISLNCHLKKFTTTLSGLHKRHNQGNPPLTRSQYNHTGSRVPATQAVLGSAKAATLSCARSRDLLQIQEAARALRLQSPLLLEKQGRAKGTAKPPLSRSPISSQHTSLCSPPSLRYPALLTQTQPLLQMQKLHS